MTEQTGSAVMRGRLALIGALAGVAVWALIEVLPDLVSNARLLLFVVAGGLAFFAVLLALLGPVRLVPAAIAAALMSMVATLLLVWASLRYEFTEDFMDTPLHVLAYAYMLAIAVPFVASGLTERGGWRRYALLFDTAWFIVVRYAAALLFVAVVWGVVMLSDALLGLVGITVIDWLLEVEPVPYVLSGFALGLGLAIVHELSEFVSPFLIIQLMRVLLPVLLAVLAVFILALPFRGLSGLFGGFSAAGVLSAVGLAAITLITTAIHRDADMAVEGRGMLAAVQALAVLAPVPAALAVYAVWVRIGQYGLTPDRVAAQLAAIVILIYALAFAAAVLMRSGWAARLRTVNRVMALGTIALAALWLTPALNAERMSVASQVDRARAEVAIADLALWEMAHEWGLAGRAGLAEVLEVTDRADHAALVAAVERAQTANSKWRYVRDTDRADIPTLDGVVTILPAGTALPPGAFDGMRGQDRQLIHSACAMTLPDGGPACVVVLADYDPLNDSRQAIGLFQSDIARVRAMALELRDGAFVITGGVKDAGGASVVQISPETLAAVAAGRYAITPVQRNALEVEGLRLVPQQ